MSRRKVGARTYQRYSDETLQEAIRRVKAGEISQREASKLYQIPRSTIINKVSKKHMKSVGHPHALTPTEEKLIADRFVTVSDYGFPLTLIDAQMVVKSYLDRVGKRVSMFKNNIPGTGFMNSFMKRHGLGRRLAMNIKKKRAAVSRPVIDDYFDGLETSLDGLPPQNIINYDESNLTDDPGRVKCIFRRGTKYPEKIQDSSKTSISLMWAGAGDGTLLPPYVVYRSKHLYDTWCDGGPAGARYGRTMTGWFDEFCFQDWFVTIALPYLKNLDGTKALIGDNLSSHLSDTVIRECGRNNIRFICLPPNSTHLTQPLDRAVFGPMKRVWRSMLSEWKTKRNRSG